MLTTVVQRRQRVAEVITATQQKIETLQRQQDETRRTIDRLKAQMATTGQRLYDDKATILLVEDERQRQELTAEIAPLETSLPVMDKEAPELEAQILPHLAAALKETEA